MQCVYVYTFTNVIKVNGYDTSTQLNQASNNYFFIFCITYTTMLHSYIGKHCKQKNNGSGRNSNYFTEQFHVYQRTRMQCNV